MDANENIRTTITSTTDMTTFKTNDPIRYTKAVAIFFLFLSLLLCGLSYLLNTVAGGFFIAIGVILAILDIIDICFPIVVYFKPIANHMRMAYYFNLVEVVFLLIFLIIESTIAGTENFNGSSTNSRIRNALVAVVLLFICFLLTIGSSFEGLRIYQGYLDLCGALLLLELVHLVIITFEPKDLPSNFMTEVVIGSIETIILLGFIIVKCIFTRNCFLAYVSTVRDYNEKIPDGISKKFQIIEASLAFGFMSSFLMIIIQIIMFLRKYKDAEASKKSTNKHSSSRAHSRRNSDAINLNFVSSHLFKH